MFHAAFVLAYLIFITTGPYLSIFLPLKGGKLGWIMWILGLVAVGAFWNQTYSIGEKQRTIGDRVLSIEQVAQDKILYGKFLIAFIFICLVWYLIDQFRLKTTK